MDKKEIAGKVIKLCKESKAEIQNVSLSQLHNLRTLVKRTQVVDEIKIYLDYQSAREDAVKKFFEKIKNELENMEREGLSREDLKYFIGNLVRYAYSMIKEKKEVKE